MEFARRQLEKYGWSDGKGLGRREDGIAEPLRPKLKRSSAGVGHEQAAELNDHWWSALYDTAAANVQVKGSGGKTKKISTKDPDAVVIAARTWRIRKRKPEEPAVNGYLEHFVKRAVLTSGGVKTERVGAESESEGEVEAAGGAAPTDEELFAACGGRTAHKGARHGLRAMGKLARIEEQERNLLKQARYNGYSQASTPQTGEDGKGCKGNKEKQHEDRVQENAVETVTEQGVADKSKKRKKNKVKESNATLEGSNENAEDEDVDINKRKRKKKKDSKDNVESNRKEGDDNNTNCSHEDVSGDTGVTNSKGIKCNIEETNEESHKKKRKKNKNKFVCAKEIDLEEQPVKVKKNKKKLK